MAVVSSGELEQQEEILNEEGMLNFCYLLQGQQLLTKSELGLLLDRATPWLNRLEQLNGVLENLLGPDHPPIGILVKYSVSKLSCLVEAWKATETLKVIGKELQEKYSTIGDQPEGENSTWLWSGQVFSVGQMYVVKMATDKKQTQQFSVEELNNMSKWRALLIGGPGIGKTSFVWKLTQEWVKGNVLESFLALFYINIKDKYIDETSDIEATLLNEMKHMYNQIQTSQQVLFILDGFNHKSKTRWDLLVSKKFPHASLLITAHTISLPHLSSLKWHFVYKMKGMLGHPEISDRIQHDKVLTEKEASSLFSLPIVMDITAKVLFEQTSDAKTTVAKLVHEIIRGIIKRHLKVDGKDIGNVDMEGHEFLNNQVFNRLCRMAFHYVPGSCSVKITPTECFVETFGLADPMITVNNTMLYTFYHKVLQSFLAAVHMAGPGKDSLETLTTNPHYQLAWYFYGYLNPTYKPSPQFITMQYYVLGANNGLAYKYATESLQSTRVTLKDKKVTCSFLYTLGQLMAHAQNTRWFLEFLHCDIQPKALVSLKTCLSEAKTVSISKMTFIENGTSQYCTDTFMELVRKQRVIEQLVISHNKPSPNFTCFRRNDIFLTILLHQQEHLQVLTLVNIALGLDGVLNMLNGIKMAIKQYTFALREITLERNNLGPTGIQELTSGLPLCTQLTKLTIKYNNIEDIGAEMIAKYVGNNTLLETLAIIDSSITIKGSRHIAEALKHNVTVVDIKLHKTVKGSLNNKDSIEWIIHEARRFRDQRNCKDITLHYGE